MWYNVLVVLAEILTTGRRWAHGHNYLLLATVLGGVIVHYIVKWLDGGHKDN